MILIVVLFIILFISYLLSFLFKPFIDFFYGDKIKKKLNSLRKDDAYYREKYRESRKYIDSLDKGFLKSVGEAFHGSDCSEEDYITEKKKEEEKSIERSYDSELSLYSFGLSFLCILGLVGFGFFSTKQKQNPEKPKNPIAEKKADFKRICEGLDLKTIEADFKNLSTLQEQSDMMKKRAKVLYKNGLILRSQYQQAKDNKSAIGINFNKYYFCIQAREDYKRSIAAVAEETEKEILHKKTESNTKQPENEPVVNIGAPIKKHWTDLEIKEACGHCATYYNCEIRSRHKVLQYLKSFSIGSEIKVLSCAGDNPKSYTECNEWESFLSENFISKKHEDNFYNANYKTFPDYFEKCTEKQKVSCITSYCRSNHPNGVYEVTTERCDLTGQIGVMKFSKAVYCGKLRNRFFKIRKIR